ncbi:WhiB family transcriptional regulator [Streptomyces sp. NPDC058614]|uniref:WhiB family transcriptional regulator n=1 Tax=Streptomyces sp. NPDC058614 TaxID=3346557 RepID=UPI00365D9BEF
MSYTGSTPDTEPAGQWLKAAACRAPGIDPDLFFPDNNVEGIGVARAICGACPVRRSCLEECLRSEAGKGAFARFGVYAGLSPRQRVRAAERRRKADA